MHILSLCLQHFLVLLKGAALTAILLCVFFAAHRLFFSPISHHPGPIVGKLSPLWAVYHAWRGDLAHTLWRLHEVHGDVVHYSPNLLSLNTLPALSALYSNTANVRKSTWYIPFAVSPKFASTHTTINRAEHRRKRTFLARGFSPASMKVLTGRIVGCVETWTAALLPAPRTAFDSGGGIELADGWGQTRDMADWAGYLTVSAMGELVFSADFGLCTSDKNRWLPRATPLAARSKYATCFMPVLRTLGLERWLWPDLLSVRQRLKAFSDAQLRERYEKVSREGKGEKQRDLFRCVMEATDDVTGETLRPEELESEANLLIAAGGDTTSAALAGTLFFLLHNCDCLERVTAELRDRFQSLDSIVPGAELDDCVYLRACIDESMRLAPPVPSPLLREALAGGVHIGEHFFPEGTDLCVTTLAIMRKAEYYPDPLNYKPERWLEDVSKEAKAVFCPFSIGPRACIGKKVAYMETLTALGRVLWGWDMRLAPGWEDYGKDEHGLYKLVDGFQTVKEGPMVQFRIRRGPGLP
ncbi:cytochrome P450 [Myriangium duriaei CBS 260.36]|uniref:Cytochrome P450 n=1 Tax=Myriangium duriaei CBS 260.36 TaxID=1168546 RepID=A0A9P4IZB5_9PEZI|nr:cytochrome P450 [Myriangium duriaei CBS 260.36]